MGVPSNGEECGGSGRMLTVCLAQYRRGARRLTKRAASLWR